MRARSRWILWGCALLCAFCLGASGLFTLAQEETTWEEEGRLIGVLVTTQPLDLFDLEAYLSEHPEALLGDGRIDERFASPYEDRLYAQLEEGEGRPRYVFAQVQGYAYMAPQMQDEAGVFTACQGDEVFADGKMGVTSTDEEERLSLEATMYVPTDSPLRTFYANPVYQAEDGSVYARAGQGSAISGDIVEGMSHTLRLEQTSSVRTEGESSQSSAELSLTFSYVSPPARIQITQMSEDDEPLVRQSYRAGELPKSLSPRKEAAYLLVEGFADGEGASPLTRALYQRQDEGFETLFGREDGLCGQQYTALDWQ